MSVKLSPTVACAFATFIAAAHAGNLGYTVTVDGKPVDVTEIVAPVHWVPSLPADAAQPYAYAQFDAAGEATVHVTVEGMRTDRLAILPASACAGMAQTGHSVSFRMKPGRQLVVEPNGRHRALVIAANPQERDVPDRNDPNTVWVGPGRHRRNIKLASNQTLYLAPGAVVEGNLRASGTNMTICGRGRFDGSCWGHYEGPGRMAIIGGRDVRVRDVAFSSAWSWCLVFEGCTNAVVENVKILGGHVLNDDGIDVCRSRNVTIRDTFIRSQDDCIAVKWDAEDVLAERCVLWTDLANVFRIGFECSGKPFRRLAFRDLDILHMTLVGANHPTNFWAHCAFCVQPTSESRMGDIRFEDVRFATAETNQILLLARTMSMTKRWRLPYATPGYLDGLTLRNVTLPPNALPVHVDAADSVHSIANVVFENVSPHGPHTEIVQGVAAP